MNALITTSDRVPVECLGQAGIKLKFGSSTIYIDPYLSDSVERIEGPLMRRQVPAPYDPHKITDADWVLITHAHLDHCDPDTLIPLAASSPNARFLCPCSVANILLNEGVASTRLTLAKEQWLEARNGLRIRPVPAAHPTIQRNENGELQAVGYLMDWNNRHFYHSGDTIVDDEILTALREFTPVDVVFLPVNEKNIFKDRLGIIGNMTVREASALANELKARILVPLHWDMFITNRVFREELEVFFSRCDFSFKAMLSPTEV